MIQIVRRARSTWSGIAGRIVPLVLASLLSSTAALLAPPAAAAAEPPVVRRTTLIVHDLDASIRFYRDVLGYTVWLRNEGQVSAESLPSEAPVGAASRFAIMKGRHPWLGMVGLLQYGDARPTPKPPAKLLPGDAILMLEVEDLAGIYARMQAAGTPVLRAPRTSEVTGAGGAKWNATFLFAWDPDGHLLEINERHGETRVSSQPGTAAAGTPGGTAGATGAPGAAVAPAVESRRAFVDTRWGQMHVRRSAPLAATGARPPLVLLHMSPLSGRMFDAVQPRLATDRVVYAPDTPGYGDSDAPPARPALEDYAEVLGRWIATLGEPVDLLGYHTGAAIAVEIARKFPDRVRRLVLVSVPVFPEETKARLRTAPPAALREDGTHLLEMWKSTMSVRPAGQSLEQVARTVADKQAPANSEWAIRALVDYPLTERLAGVTQPTLIVRPKDSLWEGTAQAAKLVKDATVVERTEWGYGLFDAAPGEIATLMREYLDRTPPAR